MTDPSPPRPAASADAAPDPVVELMRRMLDDVPGLPVRERVAFVDALVKDEADVALGTWVQRARPD